MITTYFMLVVQIAQKVSKSKDMSTGHYNRNQLPFKTFMKMVTRQWKTFIWSHLSLSFCHAFTSTHNHHHSYFIVIHSSILCLSDLSLQLWLKYFLKLMMCQRETHHQTTAGWTYQLMDLVNTSSTYKEIHV